MAANIIEEYEDEPVLQIVELGPEDVRNNTIYYYISFIIIYYYCQCCLLFNLPQQLL